MDVKLPGSLRPRRFLLHSCAPVAVPVSIVFFSSPKWFQLHCLMAISVGLGHVGGNRQCIRCGDRVRTSGPAGWAGINGPVRLFVAWSFRRAIGWERDTRSPFKRVQLCQCPGPESHCPFQHRGDGLHRLTRGWIGRRSHFRNAAMARIPSPPVLSRRGEAVPSRRVRGTSRVVEPVPSARTVVRPPLSCGSRR